MRRIAVYIAVKSLYISYTAGDCTKVVIKPNGFLVSAREDCSTMFEAAHLPGCFMLLHLHAHWGGDASCGSEHLVDGKAMSAEMQFVYWNTSYESKEVAMEKSDGLAVIAVFLKGAFSMDYAPLISSVHRALKLNNEACLPNGFSIHQLLPHAGQRQFVTYLGSHTTPPYTENVIWTIFTRPIEVSKAQLDVLRAIVSENYRECQDVCDRVVLCSKKEK